MTVGELIAKLQELPQYLPVKQDQWDDDTDAVDTVDVADVNWWCQDGGGFIHLS